MHAVPCHRPLLLAPQGIPATVFSVGGHRATPQLLSSKLGGALDEGAATMVVRVLLESGLLDSEGQVHADPRNGRWREALLAALANGANDAPPGPGPQLPPQVGQSVDAIGQVLAVCYAKHSVVSEPMGAVLQWLVGDKRAPPASPAAATAPA